MAFIGMRHVVVARVTAETAGAEPTYNAGMVAGKAITGNLTINRNNNPLYADDAIAEDDNGVTGMSLELGLDDLLENVREYMLGLVKVAGTSGSNDTYYDTEESAPYVGLGYIRVRRKNGETKYQAVWYYKSLFGETTENSQTKGETIEWQTPTLTGTVMGVTVNSKITYRKYQVFDTLSAAESWLDGLAGI